MEIWQDEDADGGYKLIRTLNYLPSNPEVEDIYDMENSGEGGGNGSEAPSSMSFHLGG